MLYMWDALKARVRARMSKTLLVYFSVFAVFRCGRATRSASRSHSFSASTERLSTPSSMRILTPLPLMLSLPRQDGALHLCVPSSGVIEYMCEAPRGCG